MNINLSDLEARFGKGFLSIQGDDLRVYSRDMAWKHQTNACAVTWPRSTQEVSELLKWCTQNRVPIVPSGGRTGLSGGAVATQGELIVSLEKMNRIGPIDDLSLTISVEAGVITQNLQDICKPHGLMWPIDFASKGSSLIGGNIATNAGGVHVIRYGNTRNWVLGMEVVLMSGEILQLGNGLEKNNSGIDLKHLFIGSEGTLGIITQSILKLAPLEADPALMLVGVSGIEEALGLLAKLRREKKASLSAFEYFTKNCLMETPLSRDYPAYVLCELQSNDLQGSELLNDQALKHSALAQTSEQRDRFWRIREGISESLSNRGWVHKYDVAVPVFSLKAFTESLSVELSMFYPQYEVCVFGHLGDGNLHINIVDAKKHDRAAFERCCTEASKRIYKILMDLKGTVSAEHGIGLLKKAALPFCRTEKELAIMRELKCAFDPLGLMNPGKSYSH